MRVGEFRRYAERPPSAEPAGQTGGHVCEERDFLCWLLTLKIKNAGSRALNLCQSISLIAISSPRRRFCALCRRFEPQGNLGSILNESFADCLTPASAALIFKLDV